MSSEEADDLVFRYAGHASAGFNARMQTWLTALSRDVRRALGENLTALVLGGGYGRGEGGVLLVDGEERPYNDLDLILIVRRKGSVAWRELDGIQHKYESLVGIQIDFSRPLTVHDVRNWRETMMWSDLLHGHRVLDGPADILTANAPDLQSGRLAPIEATRILLNRGAGLLWAQRILRGHEPAPDPDFIRRNYYKCALALGDALLVAHGRFSSAYTGRDERLLTLLGEMPRQFSFDLGPLYGEALKFKFRPGESLSTPDGPQLAKMARQWGEILVYVESRRTHRIWRSVQEYVRCGDIREIEQNTVRNWPRNFVRNRQMGCWSVRYPRERLYRELPVLLDLCETSIPDWPARSARFLAIWKQVN
jgi:hypothetical protein